MSQPLPTDGFRWLEKHEIDQLFVKIMELGVNDEKGYILEVDLEMSKKINMITLTTTLLPHNMWKLQRTC